jgi:hypothetical protein
MAPKRAFDDEPHAQLGIKVQRIEQGAQSPTQGNDFSTSVKRKLADSKRTGQACDRCKVCVNGRDGGDEGGARA